MCILAKVGFDFLEKSAPGTFTSSGDTLNVFWEYAGPGYFHLMLYLFFILALTMLYLCGYIR